VAGDTLYLRGGSYVERVTAVTLQPGRPDARIVVAAAPGERPVIQGLLEVRDASYWTFDGINVTWDPATGAPDEHMVKLVDGVGWIFRNAEVWGARSYAAVLVAGTVRGRPADWTVEDNCVHDTYPTNDPNQDQLLYVNTGLDAGPGLVRRNLLFDATNGMGVKLGGPAPEDGGAAHVDVRYNSIYNTAQGILVAWGSHDNRIRRNLIANVGPGYGGIRAFELSGRSNVVSDNVVGDAKSLLLEDPGFGRLTDGHGNRFPISPDFDEVQDCHGFRPRNPAAQAYGTDASGAK